jgi:hypothetical protein
VPAAEPTRPLPWHERPAVVVPALSLLFAAVRLPLFVEPGIHLGWNSDAAIFGLMARSIAAGESYPLYFWGQSYMGPLTAYLAAAIGLVLGNTGPLALRVASSAETLAAILLYWLALRRIFSPRVAGVTALWLAIGPAYVFFFTTATIGGEQMFFLSALIVWWIARTGLTCGRHWLVFGWLAGIGWWIHQGTVFVVAAALIAEARRSVRWVARSSPAIRIVSALLAVWVVTGALVSAGLRTPAIYLFHPLAEPLAVWIAFQVAIHVRFVSAPRWKRLALFAAGALAGYAPVLAAHVPDRYGLSVPLMSLRGVLEHVWTFARADAWNFAGGVIVGIVLLPFLLMRAGEARRPEASNDGRGIAASLPLLTIALCLTFYFGSQRAHPGSVRYIVSALPFVYAYAAEEMLRFRWRLSVIALVTLALLIPRIGEARAVAAGEREQYASFPGAFDPRPVLAAIEARGWRVCYADYWIAHKLEWVSEGRVAFIPFHAYDRNRERSRRLAATPGTKCYVENDGSVHPFDPRGIDESISRAAAERLRRLRADAPQPAP